MTATPQIEKIRQAKLEMDRAGIPKMGRNYQVPREDMDPLAREMQGNFKPPADCLDSTSTQRKAWKKRQHLIEQGHADTALKGSTLFGIYLLIEDEKK